jgi:hypothetical protein
VGLTCTPFAGAARVLSHGADGTPSLCRSRRSHWCRPAAGWTLARIDSRALPARRPPQLTGGFGAATHCVRVTGHCLGAPGQGHVHPMSQAGPPAGRTPVAMDGLARSIGCLARQMDCVARPVCPDDGGTDWHTARRCHLAAAMNSAVRHSPSLTTRTGGHWWPTGSRVEVIHRSANQAGRNTHRTGCHSARHPGHPKPLVPTMIPSRRDRLMAHSMARRQGRARLRNHCAAACKGIRHGSAAPLLGRSPSSGGLFTARSETYTAHACT